MEPNAILAASSPGSDDTRGLLEKILAAVQKGKSQHWMHVLRAIVLSMAAFASTWSAFQASRWNGAAGSLGARATSLSRHAAEMRIRALQAKTIDGLLALHWLEASHAGRTELADFLRSRFSPSLRPAFEAWIKTAPLTDPAAPRTPFQMAEYNPVETQEAIRDEESVQLLLQSGTQAGRSAADYVQLTLMFATVLFFCSLGPSVPLPALQKFITLAALLVFTGTFIFLLTLPVAPWR